MKKLIALILLSMVIAGCAATEPRRCADTDDEEHCLRIHLRGWNRP